MGGATTKHGPIFLGWQVGSKEVERKNLCECWRWSGIKLSGKGVQRVLGRHGIATQPSSCLGSKSQPTQPGCIVLLQPLSAVPGQARSGLETGQKRGWNSGKEARQSEKEARLSNVWAGNVYSDCPRTPNGVERNEDIRGQGTTDRCWDSWTTGSRGGAEFLDLVGERKWVDGRAEVKSSRQEEPGESLWKAWDNLRVTETVIITTRMENTVCRGLRAGAFSVNPDISKSCMPERVTTSHYISFLLLLYHTTTTVAAQHNTNGFSSHSVSRIRGQS